MKQKIILIVDDELVNLEFFDLMLTKLGFIVERAMDGLQALDKVREVQPDLILLDNVMPNMTGREFTKLIKHDSEYAQFATIPIVMFSAVDDLESKIEGFELGIEDYITKPFNFLEVLARLKSVLRTSDILAQLHNREEYIELSNSMHNMLMDFVGTMKKISKEQAQFTISPSDKSAMENYVLRTLEQAGETLTNLKELEENIQSLQKEREKTLETKFSVDGIESEYQTRFRNIHVHLDS